MSTTPLTPTASPARAPGASGGSAKVDLPLLRRGVAVTQQGGHVVLRRLRDEITLEGPAARLFTSVAAELDGKTPLSAIAEKVSEKPARLRALVEQLEKVGGIAVQTEGET